MHRYYDWLKTLSPGEQAELLSLPIGRSRGKDQDAQATPRSLGRPSFRRLALDTRRRAGAVGLGQEIRGRARGRIAQRFPPPRHGDFPGGRSSGARKNGGSSPPGALVGRQTCRSVSKEEIDDLAHQLSAEPRKAIEAQPTLPDKAELIHQWLQAICAERNSPAAADSADKVETSVRRNWPSSSARSPERKAGRTEPHHRQGRTASRIAAALFPTPPSRRILDRRGRRLGSARQHRRLPADMSALPPKADAAAEKQLKPAARKGQARRDSATDASAPDTAVVLASMCC